ncbi:hypothetical protein SteCoe_27551 [Stentor coeruleus]|uniref:Uncharacterized protein n=1 Tax=Stentor coeruleus TaxID=5963 RepID=A0A1R2BAC7_9CILI|nr:hypothetical protein SteCoe_27551 [Stentor coeruleus]
MQDSRSNIMFRKTKSYNGRNNTSSDSEYAAEQSRIGSIKQRREKIKEHRRVVFYGSSQEKSELKARISLDAQFQLIMKEQKFLEEKRRSDIESEAIEKHRKIILQMERQKEMEKKQRLREVQEANRLASIARRTSSLEKKVLDDMRDREIIQENIYRYQPNVF